MRATPFLFAGCLLALIACKEKASPETGAVGKPETAAEKTPPAGLAPELAVPDTFQAALGKVYEGYTLIQTALAQDDLAQAKAAFSSMHAVLHMMPKDGMDAAAMARWDSTDARIMAVLHPMASAESIDSVRAHFMDFSAIMVEAIQTFGLGGDAPVYQFHCPMADNNQGADWLQKDKQLQNPYFGKAMPACGNLVKTIKG